MTLAYDEVWVREPRLMVPRQKPVGPVKVDRAHPIGRDVVFCSLGARDLHSGAELINTRSSAVFPQWLDQTSSTLSYLPAPDLLTSGTMICKVMMRAGIDIYAGPTYGYYASAVDTMDIGIIVFDGNLNLLFRNDSNSSSTTSLGAYSFDTAVTCCEVWDSSNDVAYGYVNGVYVTSLAMAGSGAWTPDSRKTFRMGDYAGAHALYEYWYMISRKLSSAEVLDLYVNPYQFLIPA